MVLGEPLDVMIEGVQAGGCEDPDLSHRTAGHPAITHCRADDVAGPGENRSPRRAEPLRQGDRDEVEGFGAAGRSMTAGDGGVEQARAVEVRGDAALACGGTDGACVGGGKTTPPARLCVSSTWTSVVGG